MLNKTHSDVIINNLNECQTAIFELLRESDNNSELMQLMQIGETLNGMSQQMEMITNSELKEQLNLDGIDQNPVEDFDIQHFAQDEDGNPVQIKD